MASKRGRDLEDAKRRKLARQRFRGLIRSVISNRIWLSDIGDQKLSLNVKKNIAMLVRTQRKIGMLTMAEKALLSTHVFWRSIEDRKKLTSFMASLTCLSRFPPKVRARLAPVVKFLYAAKGRQIMKEGDFPMTIYFILTGEVEISTRVFDLMKNDYVDRPEFICGPGDCLGEVEMIENIPRKNTYTVISEAELLVVFEDDFDNILRPIMTKQWDEKKTAFTALEYFNFFKDDQLINACKLGILQQFEPLETIYYEDKGQTSYVYFVLSGECMILQCLKMRVRERNGDKIFELVDISKEDPSSMFQDVGNKDFAQKLKQEQSGKDTFDIDQEIQSNDSTQNVEDQQKKKLHKMDIKSIEETCARRKLNQASPTQVPAAIKDKDENVALASKDGRKAEIAEKDSHYEAGDEELSFEEAEEQTENGEEAAVSGFSRRSKQSVVSLGASSQRHSLSGVEAARRMQSTTTVGTRKSRRSIGAESVATIPDKTEETRSSKQSIIFQKGNSELRRSSSRLENAEAEIEEEEEDVFLPTEELEEGTESVDFEEEAMSALGASKLSFDLWDVNAGKHAKRKYDSKIENHFVDVGSVTYGGIFSLGEKLEHRIIMARTAVQCLMLPRFWLFERKQNPGNIWQRRRFYLDCTVPSREKIFKDFLATRRWKKFKNDFIESNLNAKMSNPTKTEDIPIICRIIEADD